MNRRKEISLKTGRESNSGQVRVSGLIPGQLSLSVSYKGERAATVTLTREQVRLLRRALAELEPLAASHSSGVEAETGHGLKIAA